MSYCNHSNSSEPVTPNGVEYELGRFQSPITSGFEDDVEHRARSNRSRRLMRVLYWGVAIVSIKVLVAILYQYRWYFPPNFDVSPFLAGRRFTFTGIYRIAFYVHIVAGPLALILGTILIASGGLPRWKRVHRITGKTLFAVILGTVVPSGLVMSLQAYAGPIAEVGFIVQSILTGVTVAVAAMLARSGKIEEHRCWATRCYILLWSPLLLRMVAGSLIVTDLESEWTYRLNAWLSWLLPLVVFESLLVRNKVMKSTRSRNNGPCPPVESIETSRERREHADYGGLL